MVDLSRATYYLPYEVTLSICEFLLSADSRRLNTFLNLRLVNRQFDQVVQYLILDRTIPSENSFLKNYRFHSHHGSSSCVVRLENVESANFVHRIWVAFMKNGSYKRNPVLCERWTLFQKVATLLDPSVQTWSDNHHSQGIPECYALAIAGAATTLLGPTGAFDFLNNPNRQGVMSSISLADNPVEWAILSAAYQGDLQLLVNMLKSILQSPQPSYEATNSFTVKWHQLDAIIPPLSKINPILNACLYIATIRGDRKITYALVDLAADLHWDNSTHPSLSFIHVFRMSLLRFDLKLIEALANAGGDFFDYDRFSSILGTSFHLGIECYEQTGFDIRLKVVGARRWPWDWKARDRILESASSLYIADYRAADIALRLELLEHNLVSHSLFSTVFRKRRFDFANFLLSRSDTFYPEARWDRIRVMMLDLIHIAKGFSWPTDPGTSVLAKFLGELSTLLKPEDTSTYSGFELLSGSYLDLATARVLLEFVHGSGQGLFVFEGEDAQELFRQAYYKFQNFGLLQALLETFGHHTVPPIMYANLNHDIKRLDDLVPCSPSQRSFLNCFRATPGVVIYKQNLVSLPSSEPIPQDQSAGASLDAKSRGWFKKLFQR